MTFWQDRLRAVGLTDRWIERLAVGLVFVGGIGLTALVREHWQAGFRWERSLRLRLYKLLRQNVEFGFFGVPVSYEFADEDRNLRGSAKRIRIFPGQSKGIDLSAIPLDAKHHHRVEVKVPTPGYSLAFHVTGAEDGPEFPLSPGARSVLENKLTYSLTLAPTSGFALAVLKVTVSPFAIVAARMGRLSPDEYRRRQEGRTWHSDPKCPEWPTDGYDAVRRKPPEDSLCGLCQEAGESGSLTESGPS